MPAVFLKSATQSSDLPKGEKTQIAFLGRSNVGKSSLINHLVNQKGLARTSSMPGLTQTINVYEVDKRYWLIDLPGYGYARASAARREYFTAMLGEYLSETDRLKLVFIIVDGRVGATDLDRQAIEQVTASGLQAVIIINKIDKLNQSELAKVTAKLKAEFPDTTQLTHTTANSKGLGDIRDAIDKALRK